MDSLNSKQKTYIAIAIAVFVILNLIAVLLAIPALNRGSVAGISTNSVNASLLFDGFSSKDIQLSNNQTISTDSKTLFIKNTNYVLLALPQSQVKLSNIDSVDISFGTYFIEALSKFNIRDFNKTIALSEGSRIIFDHNEGTVVILAGQISIKNEKFYSGFTVDVGKYENVNSSYPTDKLKLLSINKIIEINKLLLQNSYFSSDLNLSIEPTLDNFTSQTEITSDSDTYNLTGHTDLDENVYINNQPITLDNDGNFNFAIKLNEGINKVQIVIVTQYADTLTKNLSIIFK